MDNLTISEKIGRALVCLFMTAMTVGGYLVGLTCLVELVLRLLGVD